VKPARFSYRAPSSLAEAVEILAEHGEDAKVLAGGQSLVPMMNLRLAQPSVLVDLNRIGELSYLRPGADGGVAIGAMTRHAAVAASDLLAARCGLLASAASRIGYPAIRHRGTLGGSLAHADPVAEMPCVALTLDAELVASGPSGDRVVAAGDFFDTYFTTALAPDEVLREIRYPALGQGEGWGFRESVRKTGDFAIVAVAAHLRAVDGVVQRARIGLAGVADRPVRATAAEQALAGQPLEAAIDAAAEQAASIVEAASDIHATTEFRRHLAQVLTRRALEDAMGMAEASR
jgi:carbon-monoxide dehydrogenase medium subunit